MRATVAAIVAVSLLLAVAALGVAALDEAFAAGRFGSSGTTDGCPIAVYQSEAIPMCHPIRPGW